MPGRRNASFHDGDRSEYLATFVLSSIAAATPIPRQEDYGLDLICSLTRRGDDGALYVEDGFGVQVKSASEKKVTYGGMTRKTKTRPSEWKEWEPKWLFHQDNPFFLAFVSKEQWRVKLYSATRMWGVQWSSGGPYRISLVPDRQHFDGDPPNHRYRQKPGPSDGVDGKGIWEVALGNPILDLTPQEIEDPEFRHRAYVCLKHWVEIDRRNLVHHQLGIPFTIEPEHWETNKAPSDSLVIYIDFNPTPDMNIGRILSSIAPAIVSLVFNFHAQGQTKKLQSVKPMLRLLAEYHEQLDGVGKQISTLPSDDEA